MAAITPALIKELREVTGSGMGDCKKALEATEGDIKKAIDFLREKGLATAAKKAGRIAAEGLVHVVVKDDQSEAVIVEVNSETDFVAKNEEFRTFVANVAEQALASTTDDLETFLAEKWSVDPSVSVKDALAGKIATIGENLNIRRFTRLKRQNPGVFATYIHGGGKIGAILDVECSVVNEAVEEMGRNLCMQIAALFPKYVKPEDMSADFIESERHIIVEQIKNDEKSAGKPEAVIAKMVDGRLKKQLKEVCLQEQEYVKNTDMTVKQYVESVSKEIGAEVVLNAFACFEKGEGIEKKEEDFAAEVSKAMQG